MQLVLAVVGQNAEPLRHNARRAFGRDGGTLGRGNSCMWQLPDPTKTLSANHASIAFNGVGFTITDTSTNGVYINTVHTPLGRGNTMPLADGDTLYMASYIISVVIQNEPAEERQRLGLTALGLGGATKSLRLPPLAGERLNAKAGQSERDERLQRDPLPAIGSREACCLSTIRAAHDAATLPPSPFSPSCLCKDENFINKGAAIDPNPPAHLLPGLSSGATGDPSSQAPSGHPRTPFIARSYRPPSADSGGHSTSPAREPVPIIPNDLDLMYLLPTRAICQASSVPPQRAIPWFEASIQANQVAREQLDPGLTNDPSSLRARNVVMPRLEEDELDRSADGIEAVARRPLGAPAPSSVAAAAATPLPTASLSDEDELQGFWNALGFNSDRLPPEQRRELLAELGRALTETARGLDSILTSWAIVRNECQINLTRTRAESDNGLNFIKHNHDGLCAALAKKDGVLLPSHSVREGFNDIKAHEAAAVAAMRRTLGNVLTLMSPQRIESDVSNTGRLRARVDKAKLWDRFAELHSSMVGDIDRTAHTYIAEEFARSYDSQLSVSDEDEGKTTDVGKTTSSVVRR